MLLDDLLNEADTRIEDLRAAKENLVENYDEAIEVQTALSEVLGTPKSTDTLDFSIYLARYTTLLSYTIEYDDFLLLNELEVLEGLRETYTAIDSDCRGMQARYTLTLSSYVEICVNIYTVLPQDAIDLLEATGKISTIESPAKPAYNYKSSTC